MIRPFQKEDTESLIAVWFEASIIAHDFVPEDFWRKERAAIRDKYLSMAETYVYESDGRVAGFISLLGDHIGGLFVSPEAQRQGIGRALVLHVSEIREELTVDAFVKNPGALAFYRRMGFEAIRRGVEAETGCEQVTLRRGRP